MEFLNFVSEYTDVVNGAIVFFFGVVCTAGAIYMFNNSEEF